MKKLHIFIFFLLVLSACIKVAEKPNILIIYTDEHNFRTLGCYRELLPDDQAFVWGEGVKVETPNIDLLASEGLLCTSFYAASPVCTPSRAAFMTGLYPHTTGAPQNKLPMYDSVVTFAEILRRNGFATGYVGKWHLDGITKPGWEPERKFGWEDNRYMFNRGHCKVFADTGNKAKVVGGHIEELDKYIYDINKADEQSFATDFLADKTIALMKAVEADKPFCMMLSLPDPHGPNSVQAPFAWVIVKDGYILRHVGEIVPGLYRDLPDGSPPATRLYKILEDPAEIHDVSEEMPELLKSMREIYRKESADFPPPYHAGVDKWNEIMSY